MSKTHSFTYDPGARGSSRGARRIRGLLVALLAGVAAFALPVAPAFGEGSADLNTGPDTAIRQALSVNGTGVANPGLSGYTTLFVYAQAGETIQLGSSAVGLGSGNVLVYAPGTALEGLDFPEDPAFANAAFDCVADDPGTGVITTREQELAGPEASPDGDPDTWVPCEYVAPADGIYPVIMMPPDPLGTNNGGGTVGAPVQITGFNIAIWDITVRDAADVEQQGRAFSYYYGLRTGLADSSGVETFVYTKTGHEYQVNLTDQSGVNWTMLADDQGVVDAQTGERKYASFRFGPVDQNVQTFFEAEAFQGTRYPQFLNRVDPVAISGAGGLAATGNFSTSPISPASNPLANAAFAGSAGQSGATNRGTGGTISFTSPPPMEGLGYSVLIDTNRDGVFGNDSDFVDTTGDLATSGTNAFAWNGRDAAGNIPACGDYQYQVRATLAEIHLTMSDVENSGGTQVQRLTLPDDPALGDPFALSYNDVDPYRGGAVTNASPVAVTDGTSDPTFHAWSDNTGNVALVDTWAKLPEVQTTGTLRLLCADPQIVKTVDPNPVVPGEDATFKLEVKNNGPDAATNVSVTDDLPDSVQFKSASTGCSEAGSVVTCGLASLAPGATHTFEIVVAVPSSLDECIENSATVTNTTFDTNLPNNTSADCFKVTGESDLSIAKDPSSATVAAGGQVMYTLVVRNHGPSDDPGVKVTDPMAAGLALVSAQASQGTCTTTNNTVSCDLGALKDGGSAQILVTANVTAPAGSCGPNAINNTARVQGAHVDPTPGNNQDSAQICTEPPPPSMFDLEVTKTVNDRSLLVGQKARYRVVVRNNGPAAAPDVKLTDTLNAPVKVVSVKSTQGSCTKQIPMTCELGTIAAGDSVTITIVAKHRKATGCSDRQRNAASAVGNGTDTNATNNMDTVDVCVKKVRLKITKVASRQTVRAGDTFSYRIRVRNPTKGEARKVKVCDRLPSGLRYVSSKPKAKRQGSRQHCWTIKRLKAGKSKTFRVTVRAARGAIGRKTNTATLTSPDVSKRLRARDTVRVLGQRTPVTG